MNLERLSTLLLGSWDAREEGDKSEHLFKVFSGICRTAFGLVLAGEPGASVEFDPALHESSGEQVLVGDRVTLQRPWVEWVKGPAVRVIVRALVIANK